jgi:hypothetical protein
VVSVGLFLFLFCFFVFFRFLFVPDPMRILRSLVLNGKEYQVVECRSDEDFDAVEDELNFFEAQCQASENRYQLQQHPQVEYWGELSSFTARVRMFKERIMFLAYELNPQTKSKMIVWVWVMERTPCRMKDAQGKFKDCIQGFGSLERVHVDRRRMGFSGIFMDQEMMLNAAPKYVEMESYQMWGFVEALNDASLARFVHLTEETQKSMNSMLYYYGGHTILLRRNDNHQLQIREELLVNPKFDFVTAFYQDQFSPLSGDIWKQWQDSGKFLGSVGMQRQDNAVYGVVFNMDWMR